MMRLDKFLADAGAGTRSEVKKQIRQGKVQINGQMVKRPEEKVDPDVDIVSVDQIPVVYEKYGYYLFHKPAGCVTAREDAISQTVMDFFPETIKKGFSPVGRLDKDTEGLLLITNDGALNHRLMSPSYHVPKTYYVQVDADIPEMAMKQFASGIDIGDEKLTLPAKLEIYSGREAALTISEGRFHQVKRMFAAVGCNVVYLKRLSMGPLTLGDLPKGTYRKLTEEELALLKHEIIK